MKNTPEIVFQGTEAGTRLTIDHSGVPEGQADEYEHGWEEFYFEPMREYYTTERKAGA